MTHGILRTKDSATEIHGTKNYVESGSVSFTADGALTAAHFSLREWEFEADPLVEPTLRDGVYVAKVWAEEPEKGVKWARKNGEWKALSHGKMPVQSDHPREFYAYRSGEPWWERIVRLVAEPSATR